MINLVQWIWLDSSLLPQQECSKMGNLNVLISLNFEVDLAYLWMNIYDNRFFCVIFIVNDIISFSVKFKEKQTRKVRFYQRHMNNYHDYKCLWFFLFHYEINFMTISILSLSLSERHIGINIQKILSLRTCAFHLTTVNSTGSQGKNRLKNKW